MRLWEVGSFRPRAGGRRVSRSIPGCAVTGVGILGVLALCVVALARGNLERNVALLPFTLHELLNDVGSLV